MSDDNSFFEELQTDFLNESSFMLEQYEEYMMRLEKSTDPVKDLTDIFRVAHSVKGGAAAVGLTELSKFAHVMEDLLDLLRSKPEVVNSEVISLLLKSGDELKNRVAALQLGDGGPWNPEQLKVDLIKMTEALSGKASKHSVAEVKSQPEEEQKVQAPEDFFAMTSQNSSVDNESSSANFSNANSLESVDSNEDDVVNHDLLAELLEQLSPEDRAEFYAKEAAEKEAATLGAAVQENTVLATTPDVGAVTAANPVVTANTDTEPKPIMNTQPMAKISIAETKASAPTPTLESQGAESAEASKTPGKNPARQLNATIKVDTGRVDSVLDAVGELVVLKNQLIHDETIQNSGNLRLEAIVDQLDKAVRELYEKTLSIRMTPLKSMFIKIQRIVRDVSLTLNKPVDLNLIGEETEVERTVFEILGDPLVHLVRNSMDHGVEPKEVREQRGKPAVAKVTVSAKQSGGSVVIDISDDGGGINRDKVLNKAIERGLIPDGVDPQSIPDEQVFQFIFNPGFSTADKISDLSGRGVGLDVVKSNLDKINGKINIFSKPGLGSTFRLTIPLSTAITDGIIVAISGARYILPIHSIREIVRVLPQECTDISGAGKVVKIRESLLPVLDADIILGGITEIFDNKVSDVEMETGFMHRQGEEIMFVVIETFNGQVAFPVDDVIGQAQVVVKPITAGIEVPEIAGAAILGDGHTVLILEPSAFVGQNGNYHSQTNSSQRGLAA